MRCKSGRGKGDGPVLGGSMFKKPGFSIETLEKIIAKNLTIFPRLPIIKLAELGEASGLYGALVYLRKISPR